MAPLSGAQVIPAGWAEHHRPVADRTMTAPCRILRPAPGPPPFGSIAAPETVVWEGRCRVQTLNTRDKGVDQAGQIISSTQVLITTPVKVLTIARGGEGGDVVEAVGRRFEVQQVTYGSLVWEADLICQDNQTQQEV